MSQVEEVELPRKTSVSQIEKTLEKLREVDVIHFKNELINVKVIKIEVPITLYLAFGDHYIYYDECNSGWKYIFYVTDSLEDLAFYIHGL